MPAAQFRFVQTRMTGTPGLRHGIKFLAAYPVPNQAQNPNKSQARDGLHVLAQEYTLKAKSGFQTQARGSLHVLAQGADKYTLKKWALLLRVRRDSVVPVGDMQLALQSARAQEGLVEFGVFTQQRGQKQHTTEERVEDQEQDEPEQPPPLVNPAAKHAAEQMAARLKLWERDRLPYLQEDFDTDVDRLYAGGPCTDYREGMRCVARRAAMQYVERLRFAGRLSSADAVPHALRLDLS